MNNYLYEKLLLCIFTEEFKVYTFIPATHTHTNIKVRLLNLRQDFSLFWLLEAPKDDVYVCTESCNKMLRIQF